MATVDGFNRLGAHSFYKKHRSKDERTLFVVNVGSNLDRSVGGLASFGDIAHVDADPFVPHKTRCARVQFEHADAVRVALDADLSDWVPPPPQENATSAAQRLVAAHQQNLPATDALLTASEKCMALFERQEREEADLRAEQKDGVDDDGFTTVTYKRKARDTGGSLNPTASAAAAKKKKKKKNGMELKNFYRHQIREDKKDKLLELRARFEEDKQRIRKLKDARKFRSF